jgi:hypothetical protein
MDESKTFDAWITRYALTRGVFKVKAKQYDPTTIVIEHGQNKGALVFRDDWHRTADAAEIRADRMRKTKIGSLRKQIEKLDAMWFGAAGGGPLKP